MWGSYPSDGGFAKDVKWRIDQDEADGWSVDYREEVLPLIGLANGEWDRLRETYRWFPTALGESYRHAYFKGLDDAAICRLVLPPRWRLQEGDTTDLRSTRHIREAVWRNPHIGPFAGCGWPCTFIAAHAEAVLCCYTHDGKTVYFDGKPLADRKGGRIVVDAASFRAVAGHRDCAPPAPDAGRCPS